MDLLWFKDKPIHSGDGPALAGRLTIRRIILTVGGLLFIYITITTIFGPTPEHLRKGPTSSRPETDPYLDVPKDSSNYNRDKPAPQVKLPPVEKENPPPPPPPPPPQDVQDHPWRGSDPREPSRQLNQGVGSEEGSGSDSSGSKKQAPDADIKSDVSLETDKNTNTNNNNNNNNSSGEEEEFQEDPEDEDQEETLLSSAVKARKKSPYTYTQLLSANRREFNYAIALLLREADLALKNTDVYSVTNKDQTAPSGDIHDYLSLSKYYWPNPKTENGLPYIRRDGHVNLAETEVVRDYRLMRTMIREVHMMGMAYHFTGNKSYSDKCAMRLKQWFLDEATYMNPNINYGSLQKGQPLGARTGVLDMFPIFRVFDALHYLKQEPTFPKDLIPNLQNWFTLYVNWLETSVLAKVERKGNNNHGTYFDVQIIGIYMFLDRYDKAREVAESALKTRIELQISGDGKQPEEMARKTSWYYSVFNLQALMTLARWGDDLGVDMWNHVGPEGQSIKKAIDFMLPFSMTDGEGWPVANIKGFPMVDFLKCLQIAYVIYGDEKYLEAIAYLEPKIQKEMDAGSLKTISTYLCDMSSLFEGNKRGGQGLIWHWCLT
ncbi:alginate lyase-domain-containing protein [Mortierella sp. GBAus27b]|nr:alginate lyase-domain-containing protein [Mortierella sp. GBAus27b]